MDLCCTTDDSFYNFGFIDNADSTIVLDQNKQSVRRYVLPLDTTGKVNFRFLYIWPWKMKKAYTCIYLAHSSACTT